MTGANATYLQSITLLLANPSAGQATVSVYTNGLISPATLVGSTSPASYSNAAAETTFNASDIPLTANTTYWVVLQTSSGTFNWSFTKENTGTGSGYTHTWGESDDSGSSWQTYNVYPLQMRVTASSADTTAPGVVQFSASAYSVAESGGSVAVTVTRTGDTSTAASVAYTTSDITASSRTDYNAASGTLQFAAGEATRTFSVFVTDDSFVEGVETLGVSLSDPSGRRSARPQPPPSTSSITTP